MNIYIVRHGQTVHNNNGCYYGTLDVGLTKEGIKQAEKASKILKDILFDRIFISELSRTETTAKIILNNKSVKLTKDKRLNETNFGLFEGKNYKELEKTYPEEWKAWCNDWKNCAPPKGEGYTQVYSRVKSFMDDILKSEDENILIVTHSGVIRSIYCYVLDGVMDYFWKFASKNGDISIIKYEYGNLYIDSISHV